jgi:hypothetical protein
MYKSERILKAIGNIDDQIIERVGSRQGVINPASSHKRSIKKAGSYILIAAIITILFTVTAYAMGWFGLSARVTTAEPPQSIQTESPEETEFSEETAAQTGGYITFNGYADTPEGKASAEWASFILSYKSPLSPEESRAWDDMHQNDPAVFYGVWDDVALDKLHEIARKYNLTLHTERITPWPIDQFYQVTGLHPFLPDTTQLSVLYVYEDGSFSAEAELVDSWIRIDRGAKGVLCPSSFYIWDTGKYDEWQVTTTEGFVVNIAQDKELDEFGGHQGWIFSEAGNYLITIQYHVPKGDTPHSSVEALIEQISLNELGKGHTDFSPALDTVPTEAKPQGTLLTVERLMSSPEYLASVSFQRAYNEWYDENGLIAVSSRNHGYVNGQYNKGYYGSFPCEKGELDVLLQALAESYGLTPPHATKAVCNGSWVNPEAMLETMWYETQLEPIAPASTEDGWAMIGCEPFLDYDPHAFICWDNGSWKVDTIIYIPYGSINPVLRGIQDPTARSWPYNTACGIQVLLCESGALHYPELNEAHILYDTGTGYVIVETGIRSGEHDAAALEQFADRIDFTKMP